MSVVTEINIAEISHLKIVNPSISLHNERDTGDCCRPGHQSVLDREQRADAHTVRFLGGHRGAAALPTGVRPTSARLAKQYRGPAAFLRSMQTLK